MEQLSCSNYSFKKLQLFFFFCCRRASGQRGVLLTHIWQPHTDFAQHKVRFFPQLLRAARLVWEGYVKEGAAETEALLNTCLLQHQLV